jgi:hypothetical protein
MLKLGLDLVEALEHIEAIHNHLNIVKQDMIWILPLLHNLSLLAHGDGELMLLYVPFTPQQYDCLSCFQVEYWILM